MQIKISIFIASFLFFSLELFSEETGILFQYKSSLGYIWKTFGKATVQPKYEGEVLNKIPNGFGVLSYPFSNGKSVVGEWKNGNEWNTEHFDKEGILLGIFENGEWTLKWGSLFQINVEGNLKWSEYGKKDLNWEYIGFIEKMNPHGKGVIKSPDGEKYVGEFKNGLFDGQGEYTKLNGYVITSMNPLLPSDVPPNKLPSKGIAFNQSHTFLNGQVITLHTISNGAVK